MSSSGRHAVEGVTGNIKMFCSLGSAMSVLQTRVHGYMMCGWK